MRSLRHVCTFLLVLWASTLCFWTETAVHTGLVLAMSTLSAKGIESMDWPVPSLDVTPIEHVWDILQQQISARPNQPQTREALAQALI